MLEISIQFLISHFQSVSVSSGLSSMSVRHFSSYMYLSLNNYTFNLLNVLVWYLKFILIAKYRWLSFLFFKESRNHGEIKSFVSKEEPRYKASNLNAVNGKQNRRHMHVYGCRAQGSFC